MLQIPREMARREREKMGVWEWSWGCCQDI